MTVFAKKVVGLQIPAGTNYRHIFLIGMISGIGFTVSLFVTGVAYPKNEVFDSVINASKMGALFSFAAGFLALAMGRILGIHPGDYVAPEEQCDDATR